MRGQDCSVRKNYYLQPRSQMLRRPEAIWRLAATSPSCAEPSIQSARSLMNSCSAGRDYPPVESDQKAGGDG